MSRRSSARLSGGSDPVSPDDSLGIGRSTRKRDEVAGSREAGIGQAKRRKKEQIRQQSMFKPQPILSTSSDTPPEDEPETWQNVPPPPSERKIARRRPSMKTRITVEEAEEMDRDLPGDSASTSQQQLFRSRRQSEDLVQSLKKDINSDSASMASGSKASGRDKRDGFGPIEFLSFAPAATSQLPGLRPSSPPKQKKSSSSRFAPEIATSTNASQQAGPSARTEASSSSGSMGPPTAFVRKTRKSMMGLEADLEKARKESLIVPIPESETPMIRKNKELREAQRRSSLGMRGQRASSSLGKGEITIPHKSVDPRDFYKHISPVIPEPIRARHLIAWCGKRAGDSEIASRTDPKRSGASSRDVGQRTKDGDAILEGILSDFGAALGKGVIDTNVFSTSAGPKLSSLAPHPRNVANREIEAKEEAIIQKCKLEMNLWDRMHKTAHQRAHREIEELREKRRADAEPDLYAMGEGWMRDAVKLADKMIREGEGDMAEMGQFADVEYKVDTLLQSTHAAVQFSRQAQRFLDGIFQSLTADLRSHDRSPRLAHLAGGGGLGPSSTSSSEGAPAPDGNDLINLLSATTRQSLDATAASASSGSRTAVGGAGKAHDPIQLLRAIAAMEGKDPKPEVVVKAEQLENGPQSAPATGLGASHLGSSVGPGGIGVGTARTPRRVSAVTPRR